MLINIYIAPFRGIRDPENLCLWNPECWSLESGKQLKESRTPSTIGFRSPKSTDKESGIHGVESRIQVSWIPLHITPVKLRNFEKKKFKNKIRSVLNEQKIIIRCWPLTINSNSRNTESLFECSVKSIHQTSCSLSFRSMLLNFG